MRKETECAEAIVESHDHGAFGSEVLAVVPGKSAGAAGEAAAVDPHHDGTSIVGVIRARPHIRIQAVFAARRLTRWSRLCWRRRWSCATATAAASAAATLCRRSRDAGRSE